MKSKNRMDAYAVSISTTSLKHSQLLGTTKKVKRTRVFRLVRAKVGQAVATLMAALILFTVVIGGAAPANAGMETTTSEIFCNDGVSGLKVDDIGIMRAPAGTSADIKNATAYEKYGMAGLTWSSYLGFSPMDEKGITANGGRGFTSSQGIISKTGGNSTVNGMKQWEDATHKDKNNSALWNNDNTCSAFGFAYLANSVANVMFTGAKVSTYIGGWVYGASVDTSASIFSYVEAPMKTLITTMKDKLYFNFLVPMVMVAALWMAYVGMIKRRTTDFVSGGIWLVVAMATSVAFMTNPMIVPQTINKVVGDVSESAVGSVTNLAPKEDNMCAVGSNKQTINSNQNVRAVQCNLWYSFAYTPWVIGQFGEAPNDLAASEAGSENGFLKRATNNNGKLAYVSEGKILDVLKDNAGSAQTLGRVSINGRNISDSQQTWALYLLDNRVNYEGKNNDAHTADKNKRQMAVYANQLGGSEYNPDFRGKSVINRYMVSFVASTAAIGSNLMIVILGGSLLMMDLSLIIMTAIAPLFCLAALHPGVGRRIAMKWVWTVVNISMKRIAISLYLAVTIALLMVLVQASAAAGFLMSNFMIMLMVIASLVYRKQILGMFDGFQLGEGFNMSARPDQGSGKAKAAASGIFGAVLGNKMGAAKNLAAARQGGSGSVKKAAGAVVGGAGDKPKGKTETTNAAASDSRMTAAQRRKQEAKERIASGAGEAPNESTQVYPDNSGAGQAPTHERVENDYTQEHLGGAGASPRESVDTDSIPTVGKPDTQEIPVVQPAGRKPAVENAPDNSGSGAGATPALKPTRRERQTQKESRKRIQSELKANGFKSRPSVGNVLWAATKGAAVGAATGNAHRAMRTSSGHMAMTAAKREQGNVNAIANVRKEEKRREAEHAAKIAEQRKQQQIADREASQKARAAERKATTAPKQETQAPATRWTRPDALPESRQNAAPTVATPRTDTSAPAVKQARENAAAPQVGNGKHAGAALPKAEPMGAPGNGRRVAAPAATSTPKASAPAAPKASTPATPKVTAPAAPKVSAPAAPKVSAPVTPKVSAPAVAKAQKAEAPKAPVSAPRAQKAESPKVSAPKPPAARAAAPKPPVVAPPKRTTDTPKPPAPKLPPKRGN